MEWNIVTIKGVPQTVYQMPLDKRVDPELEGLEFSNIFKRLIIGPSAYAWPMHEAFSKALKNAGVKDAADKVVVSNIPIRA